jgi:ribonuclease J
MRLRIHRGAREIGGNCVELEADGQSILLDLGLPLDAAQVDSALLPAVRGLADGSNTDFLGVVLSHSHGDHNGLTDFVHASIPVFMGEKARSVMAASRLFVPRTPAPPTVRSYADRQPFALGPFKITPFLIDHSAFDAYALLIETNGKRVFYSGDVRAHGRKARLIEGILADPPTPIDCLLLEGTTLSRSETAQDNPETEQQLENRILARIHETKGLVLTVFSPQNIDRFVTIFRATRRAGRVFIADFYLAHVLDQLDVPSLPRAANGAFRVYLPIGQKRRIINTQNFKLANHYRPYRIFCEEIAGQPDHWVVLFRDSMMSDATGWPLHNATLIYSLWPGYLDRARIDMRHWCAEHGITFDLCHTSGHADPRTLVRIAEALRPTIVIPIHTLAPHIMQSIIPDTVSVADGVWVPV